MKSKYGLTVLEKYFFFPFYLINNRGQEIRLLADKMCLPTYLHLKSLEMIEEFIF